MLRPPQCDRAMCPPGEEGRAALHRPSQASSHLRQARQNIKPSLVRELLLITEQKQRYYDGFCHKFLYFFSDITLESWRVRGVSDTERKT